MRLSRWRFSILILIITLFTLVPTNAQDAIFVESHKEGKSNWKRPSHPAHYLSKSALTLKIENSKDFEDISKPRMHGTSVMVNGEVIPLDLEMLTKRDIGSSGDSLVALEAPPGHPPSSQQENNSYVEIPDFVKESSADGTSDTVILVSPPTVKLPKQPDVVDPPSVPYAPSHNAGQYAHIPEAVPTPGPSAPSPQAVPVPSIAAQSGAAPSHLPQENSEVGAVANYRAPPPPVRREIFMEPRCSYDAEIWAYHPDTAITRAVMFERTTGTSCEECLEACERRQSGPWTCRSLTYDSNWKICDLFAMAGSAEPYVLVDYDGRDYFEYLSSAPPTDEELDTVSALARAREATSVVTCEQKIQKLLKKLKKYKEHGKTMNGVKSLRNTRAGEKGYGAESIREELQRNDPVADTVTENEKNFLEEQSELQSELQRISTSTVGIDSDTKKKRTSIGKRGKKGKKGRKVKKESTIEKKEEDQTTPTLQTTAELANSDNDTISDNIETTRTTTVMTYLITRQNTKERNLNEEVHSSHTTKKKDDAQVTSSSPTTIVSKIPTEATTTTIFGQVLLENAAVETNMHSRKRKIKKEEKQFSTKETMNSTNISENISQELSNNATNVIDYTLPRKTENITIPRTSYNQTAQKVSPTINNTPTAEKVYPTINQTPAAEKVFPTLVETPVAQKVFPTIIQHPIAEKIFPNIKEFPSRKFEKIVSTKSILTHKSTFETKYINMENLRKAPPHLTRADTLEEVKNPLKTFHGFLNEYRNELKAKREQAKGDIRKRMKIPRTSLLNRDLSERELLRGLEAADKFNKRQNKRKNNKTTEEPTTSTTTVEAEETTFHPTMSSTDPDASTDTSTMLSMSTTNEKPTMTTSEMEVMQIVKKIRKRMYRNRKHSHDEGEGEMERSQMEKKKGESGVWPDMQTHKHMKRKIIKKVRHNWNNTKGFIVRSNATNMTPRTGYRLCSEGESSMYLLFKKTDRPQPGKETQIVDVKTVEDCMHTCDDEALFACSSAVVSVNGCEMSTIQADHSDLSSLIPSIKHDYLEKICMEQRLIDSSVSVLHAVPNFVLAGFVEEVETANGLQDCVRLCLHARRRRGYNCMSAMFFARDEKQNCLLNSESKLTRPTLFTAEDSGNPMVYFEIPNPSAKAKPEDSFRRRDSPIPSQFTHWSTCDGGQKKRSRFAKCGSVDIRKCPKEVVDCKSEELISNSSDEKMAFRSHHS